MKNIERVYVDGDYSHTRISGTKKEMLNIYRNIEELRAKGEVTIKHKDKYKEKNFKELKKRLLNNVMIFDDLDDFLEDNGYYSMFSYSLMEQDENKFKVIYKAADNCHYDLKVTFVIDTNAYKKILNDKFKEGEILNVIVTDIKRI